MSTWIDFKALRAQLCFEDVLRHYGVEVRPKGDQHHGFCPLPLHQGKRNSPSFSANLQRGIFQCFGCGAKGNILEFAALMEKVDVEDGAALRKVAVELAKHFGLTQDRPKAAANTPAGKPEGASEGSPDHAVIINGPLDFELKGLDPAHPYLFGRGLTPEIIVKFGLGFCSRGLLKDRVAIPLHDAKGRLIGYAGRVIDDTVVSPDNPKYRFPSKRERGDKLFEFRKTRFLYNGFRIQGPVDDLFMVEGFSSVWWLHQSGFPNAVATMGADVSEKQAELAINLVKTGGSVWIIPDGDAAGERFAHALLAAISPHRFVRWVKLEKERQPTDLSPEHLRVMFGP